MLSSLRLSRRWYGARHHFLASAVWAGNLQEKLSQFFLIRNIQKECAARSLIFLSHIKIIENAVKVASLVRTFTVIDLSRGGDGHYKIHVMRQFSHDQPSATTVDLRNGAI